MVTAYLRTELKVGLFAAGAICVLVFVAFFLDGNPFSQKYITYYTIMENVGGVGERTLVRTSGVHVGEVTQIDILPQGAKVFFRVSSQIPIMQGSTLELKSRGILGDVYLEIIRDQNSKEFLAPGSLIPKLSDTNDLSSLMSSLGGIAKDIQAVSKNLATVLGHDNGQATLQSIATNIEKITGNVREFVEEERKNLSQIIGDVKTTSHEAMGFFDRVQPVLENTIHYLDRTSKNFSVFSKNITDFVQDENRGKILGSLDNIHATTENLKSSTDKLNSIVAKVDNGEGTLGQLISKDDTIQELKTTLKSAQDFLKPLNRVSMEVDYKLEVRQSSTDELAGAANHFNIYVRTSPDRMYMLGLTDSPAAHRVRKEIIEETCEDANCLKKTVREDLSTPEDRARIRLNAQFSRRYENFGVRLGLFESYAGVAGDGYFFSDRLRTSIEFFEFNSQGQWPYENQGFVRLKSWGSYLLTPNIYLTLGADNLLRSKPLPFMGAGLHFKDDDLKSLIGFAAVGK